MSAFDKKKAKALARRKPQGNSVQIYRRLLSYGKPYVWAFIIAVFANILYSAIDSTFAYLLKPILNKGFVTPDPHFLRWIPFIIVILFIIRSAMNMIGNYSMGLVARSVVKSFRQNLFDHLMHLPCSFFDRSSSGQLLAMLVYNASQVSSACTDAITTLIQNGALVIGLLIVMFSISWQLSTIFLVSIPVIAVVVKLSSRYLRRYSRNTQDTMAHITHVAEEAIEGYKVVRTFGGEAYEMQKFDAALQKNVNWELKLIILKALNDSSVQLIGVTVLAVMIYVATQRMGAAPLSAGSFTAVMAAMMGLLKPMRNLTSVNAIIQRGLAGAESIFEILDKPAEKDEGTEKLTRAQGNIRYDKVSFQYTGCENPVLQDVSFSVSAGKVLALVGRSGSGKSSLVSLLPRFYDLSKGHIYIDGLNIFDISLKDLRRQFALVSQQVTLFNDTIAKNIAYGLDEQNLSEDKIIAAAKAAHAMEFIERLPEGIHTLVGENGVLLSGGQRQRLAIARAILKDAPILILDEATSALDTESERLIQSALEEVMKNRTTLVIAHRLSTIENADHILVLDQGKIIESGTHHELIAQNAFYKKLHDMQFREFSANLVDIS